MRDKQGLTIMEGDRVLVQTTPDGPISYAEVRDTRSHFARKHSLALVCFENGTSQFMGGEHLSVVAECEAPESKPGDGDPDGAYFRELDRKDW